MWPTKLFIQKKKRWACCFPDGVICVGLRSGLSKGLGVGLRCGPAVVVFFLVVLLEAHVSRTKLP